MSPSDGAPSDIYADSGARLPLVKREELDEQGREQYDLLVSAAGENSGAGLRGPGGLNLYSPKAAAHLNALSRYLRYESGMNARLREIAILVTAREMDQEFEWAAHVPVALKEGVEEHVIEVVKRRQATRQLCEDDAVVIDLGREIFSSKKVSANLFARARKRFGDRGLVELVMLMGNYAAVAAMLTAFDVQVAPDGARLHAS